MKLVLDLQGAQSQSRYRGIGRYTSALTRALLERAAPEYDIRLLFNARFGEATDALIATMGNHAAPERRVVLEIPEGIRAQPGGNAWLRRAAAHVMQHAVETLHPDVIWYGSVHEGYNDDAVLPYAPPAHTACVATLYDLIPLHSPSAYLGHPRTYEWYKQGIDTLRRCDMLFAISEWVRKDAIERLELPSECVINIGAAVDSSFVPAESNPLATAALHARHGITRPYILYNGGFDSRKNVPALITAFGALPEPLRTTYQLVIVGRVGEEEMTQLQTAVRKARLATDSVIYPGFVTDDDLIRFYTECALFVFPSLLEGFGLPPLEAMACGAPVIASHAASLPEVVGRQDALFNPHRIDEIAERMADVLGNPHYASELRKYGRVRAGSFNWNAVADRALHALQTLASRQDSQRIDSSISSPSVACVHAPGTEVPTWLKNFEVHRDKSSTPLSNPGHLMYVADTSNAAALEESIRTRPGVLLIQQGPNAESVPSHESMYRAAYKGMGYDGLLALNDHTLTADLGLVPLCEQALAVFCTDKTLADRIRTLTTAMPRPDIIHLSDSDTVSVRAATLQYVFAAPPLAREASVIEDIRAIDGIPDDNDLAATASAMVSARPPGAVRRWLVDISSIAEKDIATGVQRVVRSTLLHWLKSPPDGVRIEPVRFTRGRFHYARRYALDLLGLTAISLPEDAVEAASGDTFFGLDWSVDSISAAEPQLRQWRRRGVSLQFLVHDLLPITLPDKFHPYARDRFENWLRHIAIIADRLICVSRATADDLSRWLVSAALPYQFGRAPEVAHSPPGADTSFSDGASKPRPQLGRAMEARPSFLMVGTIEPRKGHDQALEAFEQLWNTGVDINLVIVGRFGWLMESFTSKLDKHPEREHRLFWIDDADDSELNAIYQTSTALLAASWGEGYGLPLVEAARRSLPVIARDLPVFREVMAKQATYFKAPLAKDLADALRNWLATPRRPTYAIAAQWPSWKQSAADLADAVRRQT
ncbi:glycosyltransferase family 4 protein [Dyella acidisoli]|uniref:Glycosyl transferase family 1 domain-containing protein n=1 Tax=Dyella acidisoli TaxID=1867834 RepID=A0ABQ5XQH2_9GAMM|nr:glycosyltransferase family 1 protein [Dyella acidisoli]GLQ92629.1 hypothetical protein GCM10007901_15800 [Dyella acidisoli]